ncbi:hypothetical protein GN244_ATG13690 [Phytophthora infestans]|uniref:Uncharacterized protein n=1 Tax=Phytophthora infestans TaxID=4787 RepID=A0A833RVQ1_PHYIN|nr:hypothetical protein GN244_ATG13690 [Phytophthora infestans]
MPPYGDWDQFGISIVKVKQQLLKHSTMRWTKVLGILLAMIVLVAICDAIEPAGPGKEMPDIRHSLKEERAASVGGPSYSEGTKTSWWPSFKAWFKKKILRREPSRLRS